MRHYSHGIDWDMLRSVLRGNTGGLTFLERHALHTLITGATWPEERRWKEAGALPTGTCLGCLQDLGSNWHKSNNCGAIEQSLTWMRISGRRIARPRHQDGLAPLATLAIPPLTHVQRPREVVLREGALRQGTSGALFGDASGIGRPQQAPEVVTWAVVTLAADGESAGQLVSGTCGGWFPSVARGELQALVEATEVSPAPATYFGDCQYVIDGFAAGIPRTLAGSESVHADLWRRARRLTQDHGPGLEAAKVKAHRSRTRAETEGGEEGVVVWNGNRIADMTAKGLARRLWQGMAAEANSRQAAQEDFLGSVVRGAICTRLSQIGLASLKQPRITKRKTLRTSETGHCGDHALIPLASGDGRACERCKLIARTKSSLRALAARPCKGEVLLGVHPSHRLRASVGVTWCEACGCFMSRLPRALRKPCAGGPRSAATRTILRRLKRGLPPTTAWYLQKAASEEDWFLGFEHLHQSTQTRAAPQRPRGTPHTADGSTAHTSAISSRDAAHDSHQHDRGQNTQPAALANSGQTCGAASQKAQSRGPANFSDKAIWHRDEVGAAAAPPSTRARRGVSADRAITGYGSSMRAQKGYRRGECGSQRTQSTEPRPSGQADDGDLSGASPVQAVAGGLPTARNAESDNNVAMRSVGTNGMLGNELTTPCRPTSCQAWSSRFALSSARIHASCNICSALARSRCKGCRRAICVQCAKSRTACLPPPAVDGAPKPNAQTLPRIAADDHHLRHDGGIAAIMRARAAASDPGGGRGEGMNPPLADSVLSLGGGSSAHADGAGQPLCDPCHASSPQVTTTLSDHSLTCSVVADDGVTSTRAAG